MPRQYTIDEINARKPAQSRLTAIRFSGYQRFDNGSKVVTVLCKCACGVEKNLPGSRVAKGDRLSCGCLNIEATIARNKSRRKATRAPKKVNRLRNVWRCMIERCNNPKLKAYKNYGAKGVKVCEEWMNYHNFKTWALDNGWLRGLQIDKDIKGDGKLYSPETCSFVTSAVNNANKPTNVKHLVNGKLMTRIEISRELNISIDRLEYRMNDRKMSAQDAINDIFKRDAAR